MAKLLLIDGNSMLFRAYYATVYGQSMTTSAGIPTNAIYGFALMLKKALETIEPDRIVVAFDADKENFRKEIYADYKGTRSATPDDLKIQFPIIREYLKALHITYYEQHGLEADDIIGCLAKKHSEYSVSVLTSDKDMLQLIDDNITVFLMQKGITDMAAMDQQALYERYQLAPKQIIDLKGLSGDPSDNIPGVRKVGDKTAIKLLNQYGSVEGIYEHIDEIKGKLQENLILDRQQAFMSKQLATIVTDHEIDLDIEKCVYETEGEDAYNFYANYEMRSLAAKVKMEPKATAVKQTREEKPYHAVSTAIVDKMSETRLSSWAALYLDEQHGVGIVSQNGAYYLTNSKDEVLLQWLRSDSTKIVYDLKNWYHYYDTELWGGKIYDLQIIAFLNDCKIKSIVDLFSKFHLAADDSSKQASLFDDDCSNQSTNTANKLAYLKDQLMDQLAEKEMCDLYWKIELPLVEVLYAMEKSGIRVNVSLLDQIAEQTEEKLSVLEKNIYALAGRTFNINSPKQLAEVIYDDLKLAKSTKRSTDVKVLTKLKDSHPVINELMEYRKYSKLNSTYARGLKKYINEDGKIHTAYNQCIAETGRLTSSDPNLQNISVRNEESQLIRKAFIPEEGCVLVGADYSQVELRLMAHMAKEEKLIQAFKDGMDIHTKTAMDIFGVGKDEVTSLMRRQAKAINFGIDYGMSEFGLSEQLGIPVWQAKEFIQTYYLMYPNIRRFMSETIEFCQQNGYVVTMMNRRREIPEIKASNHNLKEFGKRAAMNAPVQGSAADLIKIAMINVYNRLKREHLSSELILQIHDELILNVPVEEKDIIMKLVEEEMEKAMSLDVPLLAESTCGSNWLEVK